MFRSLPPAQWSRDSLFHLGAAMTADPEVAEDDPTLPAAAEEKADARLHDDEENSGISAGYTYFGQFIDHDITFDPASSLQQQNDPEALVDFRTPRLDLDSLYGRGPAEQPYMYTAKKFRLGRPLFELTQGTKVRDLPRYDDGDATQPKRALIGDKRNDENVIVAQFHAAWLQFHNKLVDARPNASFEDIQRLVRWHYQWLVINDFLPTVCGDEVVEDLLPHHGHKEPVWKKRPTLSFFRWKNDPFMPVEFSAAAYRFGHSMVRPIYRLNTRLAGGDQLGPESSVNKLFWSHLDVELHETALDLLGPDAELRGPWSGGWLFSLAGPIYGGTDQIQRTIVAERLLGLPRGDR